jgi:phosphoribosylformylglycinamidine synthase PurS subunit
MKRGTHRDETRDSPWDVRESGRVVGCTAVARVVVDVMPKPEILDPQGQAVTGALARLGIDGVAEVRQGKHFELEVDDAVDDATLESIAGQLLANPVIEDWRVTRG